MNNLSTWWTQLRDDCLAYLAILNSKKPVAVVLPINVTPMPTTSLLDKFCGAIRDYEGAPGDANYLNNNPGNCRYNPDGYLPKYEPVTESPAGFAVFPNYVTGWNYLEAMITGRIHAHPNWTLLQFMENYAPSSDDNNPTLYAQFIARRLGVDINYQIKNILV